MTYRKPEVGLLGAATCLIEGNLIDKGGYFFDGTMPNPFQGLTPDYDVDE